MWLHVKLPDGRARSWNLNKIVFVNDPEAAAMIEAWHKAEGIDESIPITDRMKE